MHSLFYGHQHVPDTLRSDFFYSKIEEDRFRTNLLTIPRTGGKHSVYGELLVILRMQQRYGAFGQYKIIYIITYYYLFQGCWYDSET
jgi:hypothetical protein